MQNMLLRVKLNTERTKRDLKPRCKLGPRPLHSPQLLRVQSARTTITSYEDR